MNIYPEFSKTDPKLLERMEGTGLLTGATLGVAVVPAVVIYGGRVAITAVALGMAVFILTSWQFIARVQEMLKTLYPTPGRQQGAKLIVEGNGYLKASGTAAICTVFELFSGGSLSPVIFALAGAWTCYKGHGMTKEGLELIGQRPRGPGARYTSGPPGGDGPRPA